MLAPAFSDSGLPQFSGEPVHVDKYRVTAQLHWVSEVIDGAAARDVRSRKDSRPMKAEGSPHAAFDDASNSSSIHWSTHCHKNGNGNVRPPHVPCHVPKAVPFACLCLGFGVRAFLGQCAVCSQRAMAPRAVDGAIIALPAPLPAVQKEQLPKKERSPQESNGTVTGGVRCLGFLGIAKQAGEIVPFVVCDSSWDADDGAAYTASMIAANEKHYTFINLHYTK